MKTRPVPFIQQYAPVLRVTIGTLLILSIPFVAMQLTDKVDWGVVDFVIIGTLLVAAGVVFELILKKAQTTTQKLAFGILLLLAVLYVWAELAVGIFTDLGS